jgi:hypothetical protein
MAKQYFFIKVYAWGKSGKDTYHPAKSKTFLLEIHHCGLTGKSACFAGKNAKIPRF